MAAKKPPVAAESKRIYVIVGKDDFLVGTRCHSLIDTLIVPEQRQMGLYDAEPDRVTAVEVFDELRTLPFLTPCRVVLLRNADDFVSDNREALEKYFDSPSSCGTLVLTVKTFPKTTKLCKKLQDVGELIAVEEIKPWNLAQFVIDEAAKRGKTLSRQNAQLLVDLVGDEPGRLAAEVEKLSLLVDTQKTITDAHIDSLVGRNRVSEVWAVLDAVAASDAGGAVEKLRNMLAGDNSAEYTVVGAFAWHFRRIFNAKAMVEKGVNAAQAAMKLGAKPNTPRFDNFIRQLQRFSLRQMGAILQELAETDYRIKTGQATAPVAMEQFVVRLAASRS